MEGYADPESNLPMYQPYGEMIAHGAVSYTHLDVYKRQSQSQALSTLQTASPPQNAGSGAVFVAKNGQSVERARKPRKPEAKLSLIHILVAELKTEKIDIIKWSSDPAEYIANALNPARVIAVYTAEGEKSARVIVPDNQLCLLYTSRCV